VKEAEAAKAVSREQKMRRVLLGYGVGHMGSIGRRRQCLAMIVAPREAAIKQRGVPQALIWSPTILARSRGPRLKTFDTAVLGESGHPDKWLNSGVGIQVYMFEHPGETGGLV
jgi:hypothetical protein